MATKINRDQLLKIISTVQPALSKTDYVPVLKHVQFKAGMATAFDDTLGIQIKTGLDLETCLPGDSLARTLASFNAESVTIDIGDGGEVKVSSGRSHIKAACLPSDKFTFKVPSTKSAKRVDLDDDFIAGVRALLPAVGNNPAAPASLGITIERVIKEDVLMLYATDGNTITRYQWTNAEELKVELEDDEPTMLPTRFCEQLVSLYKAFPKCDAVLAVLGEAVVAEFIGDDGLEARVFSTVPVASSALFNFAELLAKYVKPDEISKLLFPIPEGMDSAINRAVLMLSPNVDKITKLTPNDDGFKLYTVGELGEASDQIEIDAKKGEIVIDEPIYIDPVLIGRACKMSTDMTLYSRVVVFTNKRLLHIVSTLSPKKG